jgi:hypothetical protein
MLRTMLVLALSALGGSQATAQWAIQPSPFFNNGLPVVGVLPNGVPVVNPWARFGNPYGVFPVAGNAAFWGTVGIQPWGTFNPYLPQPYFIAPYWNPYAFNNPYWNWNGNWGSTPWNRPLPRALEVERGRLIPVGQIALNPITGTAYRPFQGIAQTNDGPFVRQPGTGSFSAFGAYIPGSGLYVNPFTGDAYNPGSGLIFRR